jgi:hypothetical protein
VGTPVENKKRPDLSFREPLTDSPPPEWLTDLDQAWFRGSFARDEIIFFHRPSGTAIVGDFRHSAIDFSGSTGVGGASWRASTASRRTRPAPLEWRLSFINRAPARRTRAKALDWNCQRVIVAHGEWVRAGGHALLEKSFRWLGV